MFMKKILDQIAIRINALRIHVFPKKGINPTILLWGRDWDHQTYSREGYGSIGMEVNKKSDFNVLYSSKPTNCWLENPAFGRSSEGKKMLDFSMTIR